jgi:protein-S-isoprenylcysteine O-methyltransferase Ste14
MSIDIRFLVQLLWIGVGVSWALTAFGLKPVVLTQQGARSVLQLGLLIVAAVLLFSQWPPLPALDGRFEPASRAIALTGVALTIVGAVFAIVARVFLGRNWSGKATIKEKHELICSGPYSLVRHPIYTGLFAAAVGSAIAFGEVRNLAALPLLLLGFYLKSRAEERLLMQTFGEQYAAYRQSVRNAIIPCIV